MGDLEYLKIVNGLDCFSSQDWTKNELVPTPLSMKAVNQVTGKMSGNLRDHRQGGSKGKGQDGRKARDNQ